jgi:hypothetical protein
MHPVILGVALGTQLAVQVSNQIPSFHLERTCKVLTDKPVSKKSDPPDADCLSGEKAARQQLGPVWSSYSALIRARCTSDTIALGMNSYLDLLTCLQMTDIAPPNTGSSSNRTTGKRPPN